MKKIVVWYNPNKDIYYYRIIKSYFYERYNYSVGSINNYGHIIVLIIPFYKLQLIQPPKKRWFFTSQM